MIRIGGAGTSTAEGAASAIISSQIERLCGVSIPAPLRPVTVDADALLADVKSQETLRAFLMNRRLDGDQLQILMMAADPKRSAQASIVALQSGVETGRPSRTYIEQTVVTVIDTPDGRLVAEHLVSGGKKWMVIAPGAGATSPTQSTGWCDACPQIKNGSRTERSCSKGVNARMLASAS
ncbi:espG family protein [Mycobacterium xenopi 4042]|uniref:EspG family protein n=1 Tax=Mycobacterium xenopi 4042 TaxID=1299334 RepID=X8CK30_MYCXE|nr:espG family protein [Mycobacterium xenopi 4042]